MARGELEHKAEDTGVLPFTTLDLKLHAEVFFSFTGFQLFPDFADEVCSAIQLLLKTSEGTEEDDEVSVRSASEGRAFARGATLKQRRRMRTNVYGVEP